MKFKLYAAGSEGIFVNEEDTILLVMDGETREEVDVELVSVGPKDGGMRLNTYNIVGNVEYMEGFGRRAICRPQVFDHLGHVPLYLKVVEKGGQ